MCCTCSFGEWGYTKVPIHIEGILPKGPYLPCVSMAGRSLLAGYHRYGRCSTGGILNESKIRQMVISVQHWPKYTVINPILLTFYSMPSIILVCKDRKENKNIFLSSQTKSCNFKHMCIILFFRMWKPDIANKRENIFNFVISCDLPTLYVYT